MTTTALPDGPEPPTSTAPGSSKQSEQAQFESASTTATTTAPSSQTYAAAQPKPASAPSIPAPTAAPSSSTTDTSPLPTPTQPIITPATSTSPPSPQPVACPQSEPTAPATAAITAKATATGVEQHPAAPRVGAVPTHHQHHQAGSQPQVTAPAHRTSYASAYPASIPVQAQQPPNSTTTPYGSVYQPPTATGSASSAQLPLYNDQGYDDGCGSDSWSASAGGWMESAKGWMATAGNKLAEVEAEVWRRINEAHDKDK